MTGFRLSVGTARILPRRATASVYKDAGRRGNHVSAPPRATLVSRDVSASGPSRQPREARPAAGSRRVRTPAKVNLHLAVGARRPDGYHELMTVFHAIDLIDTVTVAPSTALEVTVTGEGTAAVPRDRRNLAWRAAALLAQRYDREAAVHVHLDKAIPVAAGLAGGSADAAATLVACAALWNLPVGQDVLLDCAAELGSDVAFALAGGTAVGTGRGETLRPIATGSRLWWVLAFARGGLSTPAVYAELDRSRPAAKPLAWPTELLDALRRGDVAAIGAALHNDLQPAAAGLDPSLLATLEAGRHLGAVAGLVSGSGPTCAFLCPDAAAAAVLADALGATEVCRATRVACGPAPGASVI